MLQIILTIVVWFRGWKWYALLPMASAFVLGIFIGMTGGDIKVPALIADGLAVIALIVMCFVKPKTKIVGYQPSDKLDTSNPPTEKEKVTE